MSRRLQPAVAGLYLLVSVLLITACGGGGGGGGGGGPTAPPAPPPPPPSARMLSWTPVAEPGDQTVFVDLRSTADPDRFVLEIRAHGVTDLWGLAMDIAYPSDLMSFDETVTEEGGFFSVGGTLDTELQIVENPAGNLVVGHSRLGDVSGRDGDGLLLLLTFDSIADGSGSVTIETPRLAIDSDGVPVSTSWLGGEIEIQR